MTHAFILGAGLGTRLRPLTDYLPKPLVPLFHRPLAAWAMDACAQAGISRFAINTHHLPSAWVGFGAQADLTLFHEPVLLETGGGLKALSNWINGSSLLVHNGDIFSTLPLHRLIAAHEVSPHPVTLALRSTGDARHIAINGSGTLAIDIRNTLGKAPGTHVFTGIYCISPAFLDLLPPREKISVIPAFLELARQDRLGAIVLDEGTWLDLGDRESYLTAHRELDLADSIHPAAAIGPGARVEQSVVGPGAIIETGAIIRDCVVWPNQHVATGADLTGCIVCSGRVAEGTHRDADI